LAKSLAIISPAANLLILTGVRHFGKKPRLAKFGKAGREPAAGPVRLCCRSREPKERLLAAIDDHPHADYHFYHIALQYYLLLVLLARPAKSPTPGEAGRPRRGRTARGLVAGRGRGGDVSRPADLATGQVLHEGPEQNTHSFASDEK
jgi:hypothetical protein